MTEEELASLAKNIREYSPQQFEFGLWTLSVIGSLIERKLGKSPALSSASRIMKLLGLSAQKRLYQGSEQDDPPAAAGPMECGRICCEKVDAFWRRVHCPHVL